MKKVFLEKSILVIAILMAIFSTVVADNEDIPVKNEIKWGSSFYTTSKAEIDISNISEGLVAARYTGGKKTQIKVQISQKKSEETYTYNLNNSGRAEIFPLSENSGSYTIKVFENTVGTKYAQICAYTVEVKLRSPLLPHLYPNQFVNYSSNSEVAIKAGNLAKNKKEPMEIVNAIFDYVVDGFTYDYELARTVSAGYIPQVDKVLEAERGICFDYGAVMAAMLRSQNIPCKLVVGYAGKVYHAWVSVYLEDKGWIDKAIYFSGAGWTAIDPTFISSGKRSKSIMKYVTEPKNYTAKYAY